MPLPAALWSTRSMRKPPPNEQPMTTANVPKRKTRDGAMGKRDEGGEINPVDPELENDRGEAAGEAVDPGQENRPARFRKALKLPGEK